MRTSGEDNKGRQLLAKMGWTEGAGLGAGGSGITAPVQAGAGNQRGLGIGAEKAEEVTVRRCAEAASFHEHTLVGRPIQPCFLAPLCSQEDDDIYAQYKKSARPGCFPSTCLPPSLQSKTDAEALSADAQNAGMMLGYKFRPNPLNNPRKAYY